MLHSQAAGNPLKKVIDLLRMAAPSGFGIALVSALAALLSGLGHRWGWWDYRLGFTVLRWAAWGGVAGMVLSLLGCIASGAAGLKRGLLVGLAGIVIGALTFGLPWSIRSLAQGLPPIHDITTDTANPPRFVAILPLRKNAPNSADYGGGKIAALQKTGYPDIAPLVIKIPPGAAFDRALSVARALGWEIVAAGRGDNRIEATATTLMFGFKDDVVIRITPDGGGSRIDVRSVSRVGRSDLGTNARRIREFLNRCKEP
jgi:uncharacterized protein (DUF1499 family)